MGSRQRDQQAPIKAAVASLEQPPVHSSGDGNDPHLPAGGVSQEGPSDSQPPELAVNPDSASVVLEMQPVQTDASFAASEPPPGGGSPRSSHPLETSSARPLATTSVRPARMIALTGQYHSTGLSRFTGNTGKKDVATNNMASAGTGASGSLNMGQTFSQQRSSLDHVALARDTRNRQLARVTRALPHIR